MSAATLPRTAAQAAWTPGSSDTAKQLRGIFDRVFSSDTSVVLGERYSDLVEAVLEASVPNWDGYGALPTDNVTFQQAVRFLRALPTAIPDPEIGVDPSGQITFEWYRGPRRVFTVSLHADGDLSYAMLVGRERTYGSAYFVEEIPEQVAFLFGQFMGRRA